MNVRDSLMKEVIDFISFNVCENGLNESVL